jgi:hypothetical protein
VRLLVQMMAIPVPYRRCLRVPYGRAWTGTCSPHLLGPCAWCPLAR